jgi:hypothetical protein
MGAAAVTGAMVMAVKLTGFRFYAAYLGNSIYVSAE